MRGNPYEPQDGAHARRMKNLIRYPHHILFDMGSEGRTHIGTQDPVAKTGHCIFRMPECVSERVWEYAS